MRLALATGVFASALALFLANGFEAPSGDNLGTRAQAVAISRFHRLDLTTVVRSPSNYSMVDAGERIWNSYPLGTGFLASPIYLADAALTDRSPTAQFESARLEKLAAAILTAFAIALFFVFATSQFTLSTSLSATLLLAAATPALTNMSQGLWSQTGELLALTAALCLASRSTSSVLAPTGSALVMGVAILSRPTALLLVGLPWALLRSSRRRRSYALALAGAIALLLLANFAIYGSALGRYGALNEGMIDGSGSELPSHLLGVLFSPSRGLVWFFPALVAGLVLWKASSPKHRSLLLQTFLASISVIALVASHQKWWGGHSVGPRLLGELAVPTALAFGSSLEASGARSRRMLLWALAIFQAALFCVLHFSPRSSWWSLEVAVDANPRALWSVRDSQIAAALDADWKYEESGPYFDEQVLRDAAAGFEWSAVDLSAHAGTRYDEPEACDGDPPPQVICLPRLALQRAPENAHLRILQAGRSNVVTVCSGAASPIIEVGDRRARKIDTLFQWRGQAGNPRASEQAGSLIVEFASGKRRSLPLRLGKELLLRSQIDLFYDGVAKRFYGGSLTAPDAIQRQRFHLPGNERIVSRLWFELPPGGPDGCLHLLAVSLGQPRGE